ncbi:hypothetical protein WUBG_11583 [Wuchereria bancrofti]|uniref:Uncharacterized protein n=1 Tax=Wuchereria bancrofti TaxID=6293 RepID=J9E5E3_WUCBA|nr:hypothetical protein WUBG_11583 [Wuchereria bancrofti]
MIKTREFHELDATFLRDRGCCCAAAVINREVAVLMLSAGAAVRFLIVYSNHQPVSEYSDQH